uniref:Uncharacterized protein n=1 Tax=Anguilla anguilla TaxID=7936 RepID=A0A0E9RJG1_ANGAN
MPSQTFSLIPATVLPCNIPKTLFGFFSPLPHISFVDCYLLACVFICLCLVCYY